MAREAQDTQTQTWRLFGAELPIRAKPRQISKGSLDETIVPNSPYVFPSSTPPPVPRSVPDGAFNNPALASFNARAATLSGYAYVLSSPTPVQYPQTPNIEDEEWKWMPNETFWIPTQSKEYWDKFFKDFYETFEADDADQSHTAEQR